MKHTLLCLVILIFTSNLMGQSQAAAENKATKVANTGESVIETRIAGKIIRVIVSTYSVDVGGPDQTPPPVGERMTNCTYSRFPCNQVSNMRISIAGKKLFVPRSVFADRADAGSMSLTSISGLNVLTIVGGDAAEGYFLKVYFDAERVKKRELYDAESNSLLQTTTYLHPPILD